MIVLHFSSIENIKTSGVCVTVPQHVRAQGRFAETALINVNGIEIDDSIRQLPFSRPFRLGKLPPPFDRPDIAVFHECYRPAYLAIARELRKNGVPYVIIPHGELRKEAQRKKHLKKAAANLLLFNDFISHAAALQCVSENEIASTLFKTKKFLGTNGVEMPDAVKESFREDGAVFLYIGRYEWRIKGLDLLFDAIKAEEELLREKRCRFILHGPDENREFAELEAMLRQRRLGDLVSLRREIIGEEKKAALLDADVFIQTSRHEGMPVGILEAMSFGLPCLVTEGTSLGGEIEQARAGWVAETTAEGIAARLRDALRDRPLWAEYGRAGREAAGRRFAWNAVAENAVAQYAKLLEKD